MRHIISRQRLSDFGKIDFLILAKLIFQFSNFGKSFSKKGKRLTEEEMTDNTRVGGKLIYCGMYYN